MQYSDAFLDWLEERYRADSDFFERAKADYYQQTHS